MSGLLLNTFIQFGGSGGDVVPDTFTLDSMDSNLTSTSDTITGINTNITLRFTAIAGQFNTDDSLTIYKNAQQVSVWTGASNFDLVVSNNDIIEVNRLALHSPQVESDFRTINVYNQSDGGTTLTSFSCNFGYFNAG